jgi:hypothetical protein
MLGLGLLLLATQPVDEATPLLEVATQACAAWVNTAEYRQSNPQTFVDQSGLSAKGLFVTAPAYGTAHTKNPVRHFQVGTRSFIRIVAHTAEPKCEFESYGDAPFRNGLRDVIKTDQFAKDWALISEFGGHRMYSLHNFESTQKPATDLRIRAGYFDRTDNNVTFSGTITPTSDQPNATPF